MLTSPFHSATHLGNLHGSAYGGRELRLVLRSLLVAGRAGQDEKLPVWRSFGGGMREATSPRGWELSLTFGFRRSGVESQFWHFLAV